jgi:putative holliday junction resolvase
MISARIPRLLALDFGSKRTGVAVSDELGAFAHPRPAIHHPSLEHLLAGVAALVESEGIDEVVVGLPISMAGTDTAQTRETSAFVDKLRASLDVPVSCWDERLSSAQASRGASARDRKSGALDSAAAAIVLQAVLDSRRGQQS